MALTIEQGRAYIRKSPLPLVDYSSKSHFSIVNSTQKLEEESLLDYRPADFYPVRIGEILNERYQVLGKLAYASSCTAWLCRDLSDHGYVTLKVYTRGPNQESQVDRKLDVYNHLTTANPYHVGWPYVRTILDNFQISVPDDYHDCLVHKPLWTSLYEFQNIQPRRRFSEHLLKSLLIDIFLGLDYLHTACHMIHTELSQRAWLDGIDLKASTIRLDIEDESILEHFERDETETPSPQKIAGDRIIYTSRIMGLPNRVGHPVICDFGEARHGNEENDDDIQPEIYRAPEVILEIPWTYSVDIWNVGVMIWDLFEDKHMFDGIDPEEEEYSNRHHLAEMIALLGPPPVDFLRRSHTSSEYFDEDGNWDEDIEISQSLSLEDSEENLQGNGKKLFLQFMRSMLRWKPEERKTARELLHDPWLNGDSDDSKLTA